MTVSSESPYSKQACTGLSEYTYTFKIFDEADIQVIRVEEDGTQETLVLTTDYTVDDNGDGSGGTITTVETYTDGYLQIRRILEYSQEVVFADGGPLPAARITEALDRNVMLMQQLANEVDLGALIDAEATAQAAAASALEASGHADDAEAAQGAAEIARDAALIAAAEAAAVTNIGAAAGYDMTGLSTKDLDASTYDVFELHTIDTDFSITVSNFSAGRTITVFIVDGSSNAITWPTGWYWPGGAVTEHTSGIDAFVITKLYSGKVVVSAAVGHSTVS